MLKDVVAIICIFLSSGEHYGADLQILSQQNGWLISFINDSEF